MCIDGNALDKLPEDGNLAQMRVIAAIDSPTMDSSTSTASTCTSSSAPITTLHRTMLFSPAILVLLMSLTIHIVPTFLIHLFLQPCGQ